MSIVESRSQEHLAPRSTVVNLSSADEMSSEKRFSDSHVNHLHERNGNPTSGTTPATTHRNATGHAAAQNNKQRARATGGPTATRLSVPRPVNLPSLRKENEGMDMHAQTVPTPSGNVGWHRHEGHGAERDNTWSQHVAARNGSGNRGEHPFETEENASSMFHLNPTPLLNQEEFPSLEVATHSKLHPLKMKTPKETNAVAEAKEELKDWKGEEQAQASNRNFTVRPTWQDDERYGVAGVMPMQYGGGHAMHHHGYVPTSGHDVPPSDPYAYYPSRPHMYAPHMGGMHPSYPVQEYFGPTGDGMYAPYYPMFPPPMHPAYHPNVYSDQRMYPMHPHLPESVAQQQQKDLLASNGSHDIEKEGFDERLQSGKLAAAIKLETEHPKTPDNLSGEGMVRQMSRQQSGSDRQKEQEIPHMPVLRKMSLPKDNAAQQLQGRLASEELDWGAQVDAEEHVRKQRDIKILARPSNDSVQSVPMSQTMEGTRETIHSDWHKKDNAPAEPFQPERSSSRSSTRGDRVVGDGSIDTGRKSESASSISAPKSWRSGQHDNRGGDRWRRGRGRESMPFSPQARGGSVRPGQRSHGRWTNNREPYRRDDLESHPSALEERGRPRDNCSRDDRRQYTHHNAAYRGRGDRGRFWRGGRGDRDSGRAPLVIVGGRGDRDSGRAPLVITVDRGKQASPVPPQGRCLFPGRGFRPKGVQPRQGTTDPDSQSNSQRTPQGNAVPSIRFGQFEAPLHGEFDPLSKDKSGFLPNANQMENREVDCDSGPVNVDATAGLSSGDQPERRRLPVGPAQMDLAKDAPYLGKVLSDELAADMESASPPWRVQNAEGRAKRQPHSFGSTSHRGRYQPDYGRGSGRGGGRWQSGRRGRPFGRRGMHVDSPSRASDRSGFSFSEPRTGGDSDGDASTGRGQRFRSFDNTRRDGRSHWTRGRGMRGMPPSRGGPGRRGHDRPGRGNRGRGRESFPQGHADSYQEPNVSAPENRQTMQWVPKKPADDPSRTDQPTE